MEIIRYNTAKDIDVLFENGEKVFHKQLHLFNSGSIKQPEIRIGYTKYSNEGELYKVVEYVNSQNVIVEFQDKWKFRTKVSWQKVKNGSIKNPYHPNKYGGIVGTNKDINQEESFVISKSKEYEIWYNMLIRCNDIKFKDEHYTYEKCTLDKKWFCFWNFYLWCIAQKNYTNWIDNCNWAIDKDISIKRNKVYSEKTCFIVPKSINNLLLKHDKRRGKYPIGVTKRKSDGMFEAQCRNPIINKYVTIGLYSNAMDAFIAYKTYKENIIKSVAKQEYSKMNITQECYLALLDYVVEIND